MTALHRPTGEMAAGDPPDRRILAIDPGSERSAWLLWSGGIDGFGILPNDDLLADLRSSRPAHFTGWAPFVTPDVVVIEQIMSYGMIVGAEVFDTVHWSGRFMEAARPMPVIQLRRLAVKLAICGDTRAKDSNIRQALIDRFGGQAAIRKGGPLYGISRDVWSALAIALTYSDTEATR